MWRLRFLIIVMIILASTQHKDKGTHANYKILHGYILIPKVYKLTVQAHLQCSIMKTGNYILTI